MLVANGQRAKVVEAVDGNSIDRLVNKYKPTRVVIEALWATPAKLAQLQKIHPKIQWTVRIHSEMAFLANEGPAIEWIAAYLEQGIEVAFNSLQTAEDFGLLGKVSYLPNYYPEHKFRTHKHDNGLLDIGCFGAIRPLKNQLIQAFAAIKYAEKHRKRLVFHMNGSRIEQLGLNNLKNIKALFDETGHVLKIHPWLDHEEFLELVKEMDICLQVSLSESFNIVSADAVSVGVPLIGSSAIGWLPKHSQANAGSVDSIVKAMERITEESVFENHEALRDYMKETVHLWIKWLVICD
jgi:hypothetical protein